jgi:hypothetical protein
MAYRASIELARGVARSELAQPPDDVPEDLIKAVIAARQG